MPIQNSSDYVTIEIPVKTLNEKLPGWNETLEFYIQMNVDKLELKDTGVTWFNSDLGGKTYSVKTVLWVW
jgi:collagenase-like PrtC family protease